MAKTENRKPYGISTMGGAAAVAQPKLEDLAVRRWELFERERIQQRGTESGGRPAANRLREHGLIKRKHLPLETALAVARVNFARHAGQAEHTLHAFDIF